ncbi:MAG: Plug domain-containing protein [Nitrospira sp.]|nr:Plug domain-containing protein [Nitrospira sp.]
MIDQKQILQGRPAVGVDETLRIVPGVQTNGGSGRTTCAFRFAEAVSLHVRVRRAHPDRRYPAHGSRWADPAGAIDLDAIARVEVLPRTEFDLVR